MHFMCDLDTLLVSDYIDRKYLYLVTLIWTRACQDKTA